MNTLTVENLHKSFGSKKILDGISFSVKEGSIFGFIAQNGAGKTTTMKIILGLLRADSGEITVCGEKAHYGNTPTNRFIGYLPDVAEFYGYMRPMEYLNLCGEICGIDKIKPKSQELLELVGMKDKKGKIAGFSRGMKQRLGIAQALLSEPKLLICDEPTSALDPTGRKEILDLMQSVKEKTTVMFSTHLLSDVERICDSVSILHNGKIVLSGSLDEIKSKHSHDVLNIEFKQIDKANQFITLLNSKGFETKRDDKIIHVHTRNIEKTELELIDLMSTNKFLPTKFEIAEPTLENLFLEVVK